MRPDVDTYFLDIIARGVSTRATCPRASVGAVLVIDKNILSTGYNGAAEGEPHCTDVGCLVEDGHCQRAIHAEINAIGQAAKRGVATNGATLYIFSEQRALCRECQKVLRAAGIKRIVQHETFNDQ